REHYARALELWREVGDSHEVSVLAYDLARIERRLGQPEAALRHFREALKAAPGNKFPALHEARIRTELGGLYQYRGQTAKSLLELRRALRLLQGPAVAEPKRIARQQAWTSTRLGSVLAAIGTRQAMDEAKQALEEARSLRLELGERAGIASIANSLGLLNEQLNRPQAALADFEQAESLFRALDQTANAAVVHANRCGVVERLSELEAARDCYLQVLPVLQRAGFENAVAHTLFDLAVNARRRGDLPEAARWIGQALDVIEVIRDEAQSSDLRSSFGDRKFDFYELAIDLALERHAREPAGGHDAEAFRLLESARARSFLEALDHFRTELEAPPEVEALRAAIHRAKVKSLAVGEEDSATGERLGSELAFLLEQLYLSDPLRTVGEPESVSLAEAQTLVDAQTVLLVYYLGAQRSAVWAVTDSRVFCRLLPHREVIEELARELYEAMRNGAHRIRTWKLDRLSTELSDMILAPVAEHLDRPHLIVVPDGALRYIPFAALPHPGRPAASKQDLEPLILDHRVTSAPSASVLAALRTRAAARSPASRLLGLVADPVVHAGDARLAGGDPAEVTTSRAPRPGGPLPHTAQEAVAILELAEPGGVVSATGFEASRELVLGGALDDVRIVHFATHGLLDDVRGELSGLMLSQFDAEGRPTDGFLWAYETYAMRLAADLVVLSACDTALGESIRGEGLVGLTRGFFHAGAQQVLVSLWSVRDSSTAELMELFYRRLLRDGLDTAEALRQAQMELVRSGQAPFHWAAFQLHGDGRPGAGPIVDPFEASARKKSSRH
ncbi:MAG: CHAT domain-containing tetratricopeptide repeat protein, partial [Acidobacteriota bacterium]